MTIHIVVAGNPSYGNTTALSNTSSAASQLSTSVPTSDIRVKIEQQPGGVATVQPLKYYVTAVNYGNHGMPTTVNNVKILDHVEGDLEFDKANSSTSCTFNRDQHQVECGGYALGLNQGFGVWIAFTAKTCNIFENSVMVKGNINDLDTSNNTDKAKPVSVPCFKSSSSAASSVPYTCSPYFRWLCPPRAQ